VHVDGSGRLWVADTNNYRVLRFDNASTKASGANADGVLGQPDFTTALFPLPTQNTFCPKDVYVDGSGRLWVTDNTNNRVLRFDNAATKANGANADGVVGQLDFTSNQGGTHPATWIQVPSRIYVDGSGRLWVVDSYNSRVLRFDNAATKANGADPDGVLGHPDFNFYYPTISDPLYQPMDITGDSTGRVFITTSVYGMHIFDNAAAKPNGAAVDVTLDVGYGTAFYDPAADVLWFADTNNNRVLRFGVPSNPLSAPVISTPVAGAVITNPRPVITGTGEISATITVTEGATSICTAVVAADSTWTCTPGADLSLGAHTVSAT